MKTKYLFLLVLFTVLLTAFSAGAENVRENPSLYSFAEVVKTLPGMWTANPLEVMEMMEDYPDFECWRRYDMVGCSSVNNKYSAEIFVNFSFSSEEDDAEFVHTFFSMMVNGTEDIQKVVEAFWLDDLKAARISGASYPDGQVTLYFSNENTLMKYSIDFGTDGVWLVTVDMGLIRG